MFKGGILARFRQYDQALKKRMEKVPGGRFVSVNQGGPGWKFQLEMQTCRLLKKEFGDEVEFSPEVTEWGREQNEQDILAKTIRSQEDTGIALTRLKEEAPELAGYLRNYQRVCAEFVSEVPNCLVADDPGLGKTVEVIAGLVQAGANAGPILVICPKISIENVWLPELDKYVSDPVFAAPEGRRERRKLLKEVAMCQEEDIPFWLVVNFNMVTLRRTNRGQGDEYDHVTGAHLERQFPFLHELDWSAIVIDEIQDSGIANPSSQFARSLRSMSAQRRIGMSGTPIGGKPERLWGILHWLEKDKFASKQRWRDQWLKKTKIYLHEQDRELIKWDSIKGDEREFYEAHARYIIRREKADVASELPPKTPVDIWVHMTAKQAEQYAQMEEESVATLMEQEERVGTLAVTSVLAVDTWLRQFANGYCDLVEKVEKVNQITGELEMKYKAVPTLDSPKLEALMELLSQTGANDPATGKQVIIFSQFVEMVELIHRYLNEKKIKTAMIHGKGESAKRKVREQIVLDFQKGGVYQAIVMTTKSGGVSITLDRADDVIFIDETWNPDDKTQASDRAHRISRIHNVTVYSIRTRGTIEEDVMQTNEDKRHINDVLLDRYRRMKNERVA